MIRYGPFLFNLSGDLKLSLKLNIHICRSFDATPPARYDGSFNNGQGENVR